MPPIARWFIKTALVYFVLALGVGLLLALAPFQSGGALTRLLPVYIHMLTVGWISQLIFGVGIWMFPKYTREKPRGSETLAWVVYGLINLGLILRAIAEPQVEPGSLWAWLLVFAATLQWLGGILFVANTWPRIKER